jgi:hypothetical protein
MQIAPDLDVDDAAAAGRSIGGFSFPGIAV